MVNRLERGRHCHDFAQICHGACPVSIDSSRVFPCEYRILVHPTEAARGGYFDFVVDESAFEGKVTEEAQRLRTIDMPSFKATKERINAPSIEAISSALNSEWAEAAN